MCVYVGHSDLKWENYIVDFGEIEHIAYFFVCGTSDAWVGETFLEPQPSQT